jgi:uncharacterized protein (DUF433 family)
LPTASRNKISGGFISLSTPAEPVPLLPDSDGVMRIGGTRVTLDTVIAAFREGLTPESIVEQYPTLRLPDVYSVIGYYLNHADKVDAHLRDRQRLADDVRRENEVRFDPAGVGDRLLARRSACRP